MKKNDLSALRSKGTEVLKKEVSEKKVKLLKNNDRKLRREVAQILTIISEKEIMEKDTEKR